MKIVLHEQNGLRIAEVLSDEIVVRTAQDALDLMMDPELSGTRRILVQRSHIEPAFFDLSTGLAGDIAQKFVNYNMQLAIVGEFESTASESLKAFIRESNRGRTLFFAPDIETAKRILLS